MCSVAFVVHEKSNQTHEHDCFIVQIENVNTSQNAVICKGIVCRKWRGWINLLIFSHI